MMANEVEVVNDGTNLYGEGTRLRVHMFVMSGPWEIGEMRLIYPGDVEGVIAYGLSK